MVFKRMTGIRLTTLTLCLGFVVTGIARGQRQDPLLTPVTAALRLSAKLTRDSYDHERATKAIATSYWRRGDYDSAFAQIETLQPGEQVEQLGYCTSLAIKSGETDAARRALNRALKLIVSQEEDSRRTGFGAYLADLAVEINDLELASRFTDTLDEGSTLKAGTLVSLAEARAQRGEKDKAVALLDLAIRQSDLFDEDERSETVAVLTSAANAFVTLGEKESATKLANQVNEFLLTQEDPQDSNGEQVGGSFARLGELSHAMSMVESLDDDGKVRGLVTLASIYQARGDEGAALSALQRARELIESTTDLEYNRSVALDVVAHGYLRMDKPDEAFAVLRGITYNYQLVNVATELAASFAAKGRRPDASAALDFAYSQIRNIVSEKSEDIPGTASSSLAMEKSRGLSKLGEKFLEIGDLRGAEAAAKAIDQPQYRASLLGRVAMAYARQGNQSRAKSLLATAFNLSSKAEDYNHDLPRDDALLELAEAYADSGLKQESANVILRLLRELRDDGYSDGTIGYLIEVGLMAETKGVPLNRNIQAMLKQVIKKEDKN
jgi:hypothetical protein